MNIQSNHRTTAWASGAILCLVMASAGAQAADPPSTVPTHPVGHAPASMPDSSQMQQELTNLRVQMRQLEQRMASKGNVQSDSMPPPANSGMAMGGNPPMGPGMGAQNQANNTDAAMPMPAAEMDMGMGMMQMMEGMRSGKSDRGMMGMGAMGGMNSVAAMATPSALPGFPGQSHLYHIGATDFFLDHAQHIALTTEQQQSLAQKKQQWLIRQSEVQSQIDSAEQELWQLTGMDQPQIDRIEKQAREIERLRGDLRIGFIRAVGEAAQTLAEEQRQLLTGMQPHGTANRDMEQM